MPAEPCANHASREAAFRCDGCGRLLCEQCVEEGHRLLFCKLCRERALPLAPEAPATTPERQRAAKIEAPYSLADALRYPFRGLGLYVYLGYIVFFVVLRSGSGLPGLACGAIILQGLVLFLLVPGMIFEIVRTSAGGETQLPDWPDFSEYWERLQEVFKFFVVVAMAFLPVAFMLGIAGCDTAQFLLGERSGSCWLALAVGAALGAALWVIGLGATGVYESGWLAFRLDLHVQALIAGGVEAARTVVLVLGLFLASQAAAIALSGLPLLGTVLEQGLASYGLFTGSHLIGLLFRHRSAQMERIYLH